MKKKKVSKLSRRNFLKTTAITGLSTALPLSTIAPTSANATALPSSVGNLSDPAIQPKFTTLVESAFTNKNCITKKSKYRKKQKLKVIAAQYNHMTGLVDANSNPLMTPVWGYGRRRRKVSWPGGTIETFVNKKVRIRWKNKLIHRGKTLPHLLPVDDSFHWAFGLPGYKNYTIAQNGVPLVPHVHGAHVDSASDGNPEYFFTPNWKIKGPRWVHKKYKYDNTQKQAGALWYHDHSLGITRLNVYAGLAGFYIVRDNQDTGRKGNPLGLPYGKHELGYVIQDRMFKSNGELFFPSMPNDPAYADFITTPGANLPAADFPNGGPTVLAEFFGDHMVVNGKIWPKQSVEARHYRLRLLNGSDSRFLGIRFRIASSPTATTINPTDQLVPFWHIGGDQGLAAAATQVTQLVVAPAERPDIVIDFSSVPAGSRIIMENIAGDAPFDGTLVTDPAFDPANLFANRQTDRIMAFDVTKPLSSIPDNFDPALLMGSYAGNTNPVDNVRKLALFEGRDEFGRLQPMLGVAEPTVDISGNTVDGSTTWHMPITENPALGSTEIWEIYNNTVDAHPIHVHLVDFEILNREKFTPNTVTQNITLHNGTTGTGARMLPSSLTPIPGTLVDALPVEKSPRDMVICYPGEITRIKMTFDKPGRYVWHCHILSHEDHDMMRPIHVGPDTGATTGAIV
jgi:FtsP/CotA-like multicopper oxidase with cupredoxin domain